MIKIIVINVQQVFSDSYFKTFQIIHLVELQIIL